MRTKSAVLGALGVVAIFTVAPLAPPAWADPAPAPGPGPAVIDPADPLAAPAVPAVPADPVATPAEGVPHLASPENLPPGTTDTPTGPEGRRMSYLRDLWHAVQTQEVSGGDALLLLTQRSMDPNAAPPPGTPAGPAGPMPDAPAPAPLP
jgi:hypothetical protein